jgi:hypothetical protein
VSLSLRVCVCVCVSMHVCVFVCMCAHMSPPAGVRVCACVYVHACLYVRLGFTCHNLRARARGSYHHAHAHPARTRGCSHGPLDTGDCTADRQQRRTRPPPVHSRAQAVLSDAVGSALTLKGDAPGPRQKGYTFEVHASVSSAAALPNAFTLVAAAGPNAAALLPSIIASPSDMSLRDSKGTAKTPLPATTTFACPPQQDHTSLDW